MSCIHICMHMVVHTYVYVFGCMLFAVCQGPRIFLIRPDTRLEAPYALHYPSLISTSPSTSLHYPSTVLTGARLWLQSIHTDGKSLPELCQAYYFPPRTCAGSQEIGQVEKKKNGGHPGADTFCNHTLISTDIWTSEQLPCHSLRFWQHKCSHNHAC